MQTADNDISLQFSEVHSRLVVVLGSDDNRLHKIAQLRYPGCCIVGLTTTAEFKDDAQNHQDPLSISLEEVYRFDGILRAGLKTSSRILVCAGNRAHHQIRICLLLGCHLMISQGLGFEETILTFRPMHAMFASSCTGVLSIEQYLRAVCCAKCLKWIDFQEKQSVQNNGEMKSEIQMDEYMHYTRFRILSLVV